MISRWSRLSDTRYSAKGSAREKDICIQQVGCIRDYTGILEQTLGGVLVWCEISDIAI